MGNFYSTKGKRAVDIVLAIVAIVLFAPLLIFFSILIKLTSKGPIIYKQERVGKNEKPFTLYKFRTMEVGRELEGLTKKHDSRITLVGRLLRKNGVDEMPQFFNVLEGSMSIVGPRPVMSHESQEYDSLERSRFKVKPGLFCLSELEYGYSDDSAHIKTYEKVKLDAEYVEKQSFWFDLWLGIRILWKKIIFREFHLYYNEKE